MNRRILHLVFSLFSLHAFAAEERFWTDNKITPGQPFPAKVRAVGRSWVGYNLLLEEIGGEHRLCFAQLYITIPLSYTTVAHPKQEQAEEPNRKEHGWTYVSPSIDVDAFSWSIGIFRIGRIFGDDDMLRKVPQPKDHRKREPYGADHRPEGMCNPPVSSRSARET